MGKDPAVLLYTGDFLSGTSFFNDEQRGQYIKLLCEQHQNGHIPKEHMLEICKTYDSPVLKKFIKDPKGLFFNERMEIEILRRQSYSESRRNNRAGGNKDNKLETHDTTYDTTYDVGMSTHMGTGTDTIIEKYNSTSFPKIQKLTEGRKKHLKARIKEYGVESVLCMIDKAEKSDFLHGENDRKWKADFDWLINPNNYIKVIEGKYDNKAKIRVLA